MRFDDMLATLLAQPEEDEAARVALWRQLVDLLAQGRFDADGPIEDSAFDALAQLRSQIPSAVKAEAARSFAGRPINATAVALFADEPAPVLAPLIAVAQLDPDGWIALLPRLTPTARALLRHRRDLPRDVMRALDSFGTSDLVLAGQIVANDAGADPDAVAEITNSIAEEAVEEEIAHDRVALIAQAVALSAETSAQEEDLLLSEDNSQIRDLMARIEAYRADDFVRAAETPQPEDRRLPPVIEDGGFRFETGPDGVIRWVAGAPRASLIGETIAVAGQGRDYGVDGYVAGAFRQRAPFRDARFKLAGDSALAGEWRISAVPMFDHFDGHFCGYRGSARRPRVDEVAAPSPGLGIFGTGDSDTLRQLVHELRTPLNAIIGFSEMIEGQLLGPASAGYRGKAADIGTQGRRLMTALEDLDLSARLDARNAEPTVIDPTALIERLHGEYQLMAEERGFSLKFRVATDLGQVAADAIAVERMFSRLLAATLGVAERSETIAVELGHDPESRDRMILAIGRPHQLEGRDERTLLDPGYNPEGDWPEAPVLGLGFALRLVRNIAIACGGALDIQPDRLVLRLPLRKISKRTGKG